MIKKCLLTALSIILTYPVFAYEDCIITTNGKLTDIKIQYNDIIDVYPLVTLMNDKNTLIVHPLKEGCTKFSIVKNDKEKIIFDVEVKDEGTVISQTEGFDVLAIDCPPNAYEYLFDLDEPPGVNITEGANITKEEINTSDADSYIKYLDEPPVLRGEN